VKRVFLALVPALGFIPTVLTACDPDCCTVDSFPIMLERAGLGPTAPATPGALVARAQSPEVNGGVPFTMVVDTGAPLTLFEAPPAGTVVVARRSFNLFDAVAIEARRASFREVTTLPLPLGRIGDGATTPLGVLGADLLRRYSVELRFGRPSITFWSHLAASDGFLQDAGFAVLQFNQYGGGELTALTERDFVGLRGPVDVPPTRIVLRACAAPRIFLPTEPREACCTRGAEVGLGTGVDLALVVATGVGPLVLGRESWDRIVSGLHPSLPPPPPETPGDLLVAGSLEATPAGWTTLPRLALVDLQASDTANPGACVELARSRRIEWVAHQQVMNPESGPCVQPCDTDPRESAKAQHSAAYLELGGDIPVAVIAERSLLLQSLRSDVRPEGPEVNGILGAGVLTPSRLEIDYRSNPSRAVFSCEGAPAREACFTAPTCPRLPDRETPPRTCFGLPPHTLPAVCAPSGC
jgi:hypothetical protein